MTTAQRTINGPFPPPPCSAAHIDPFLNEDYAKALTPAPEPPRCRFLSSDKRQCRMLRADHHPDFCLFHAARQDEIFALLPEREFALAPELEALAADLTTATGVNRALGEVFRLLAKITSRAKTLSPSAISPSFCSKPFPASAPKPSPPSAIKLGPPIRPSLRNLTRPPVSPPLPFVLRPRPQYRPQRAAEPLSNASSVIPSPDGSQCDRSPRNRRRERHSGNPVTAAATNASATSAFSRPNYVDLLNRSLDLLDGKFDASPEGQLEARRLLRDLEQITPPRVTPVECALTQTRSQPLQDVHLQNHST